MEWTRPLSLVLSALVVALAVGGLVEMVRTMLGGEYAMASVVVIGFVVVALLGAVALGARSVRWLRNPDAYW
ncbi:hypothetical protein BRC75_08775 [Halobacteriales archaeon QH_7_69_31]|nr:MAG: hypothetical protein BRC75_08775 [Halobacteriales archaeon QH_7_69_31]